MDKTLLQNGARLFRQAAWAPLLVLLIHALGAAFLGHPRGLDPFMHLAGGFSVAYFLRQAHHAFLGSTGNLPTLMTLLIIFNATCTVALFWEFGEFLSDEFLGTHVQASLAETMVDLLVGAGGALTYVSASLLSRRPSSEFKAGQSEHELEEPV
jgi:hypothetical protein